MQLQEWLPDVARDESAAREVATELVRAGARDGLVAKHAVTLELLRVVRVLANHVLVELL